MASVAAFSPDRPPGRTPAPDGPAPAERSLEERMEAELGPATPPMTCEGIGEADALLELATLKVARACRDVIDDARIEFLTGQVSDPAKLAAARAAFDPPAPAAAIATPAADPTSDARAEAEASPEYGRERPARGRRGRIAAAGAAILVAAAFVAGQGAPGAAPRQWVSTGLAQANAWLPGVSVEMPDAWAAATAAERDAGNGAAIRLDANNAALPVAAAQNGSVTLVGEGSAGEDRIWRANLSDRLVADPAPAAAADEQAARIAELETRLKLLELQAQKIRDGSAFELTGGDAALSGAIARDKAEIALLRETGAKDEAEPQVRSPAAPLRASGRSPESVELAFAQVKALAALPASGRRELTQRLVAGECLATALKAVADPVPVLLMRDLVRQLDSEC